MVTSQRQTWWRVWRSGALLKKAPLQPRRPLSTVRRSCSNVNSVPRHGRSRCRTAVGSMSAISQRIGNANSAADAGQHQGEHRVVAAPGGQLRERTIAGPGSSASPSSSHPSSPGRHVIIGTPAVDPVQHTEYQGRCTKIRMITAPMIAAAEPRPKFEEHKGVFVGIQAEQLGLSGPVRRRSSVHTISKVRNASMAIGSRYRPRSPAAASAESGKRNTRQRRGAVDGGGFERFLRETL